MGLFFRFRRVSRPQDVIAYSQVVGMNSPIRQQRTNAA